MSRKSHNGGCRQLQREPINGQRALRFATTEMNPPNQPDQQGRRKSQQQVQQQSAFQTLTFKLPVPSHQTCGYRRHRRNGSHCQVVICRCRECRFAPPLRREIKRDAHQKQRDREVNQHHMLGMAGQQNRFQIKGVHTVLTAPQPCPSSWDGSSRSRCRFLAWKTYK